MSLGLSEDLPYPPLDKIEKDAQTLRLISAAYAGREGELTAVLQYIYQSMLFDVRGRKEYAHTLEQIAVSEMRHLDLLGSAVVRLGGNPVYAAPLPYPKRFYSAESVNYTREPQSMLLADIRSEQNAIEDYNRILKYCTNQRISALISRILLDEELHLKTFRTLYCKLTDSEKSK